MANIWYSYNVYNIAKEYIIAKVIYVGISKQFTLANSNEIRAIRQTVRLRFITEEVWVQSGILVDKITQRQTFCLSFLNIRPLTYIPTRIGTIRLCEFSVSRNTFVKLK